MEKALRRSEERFRALADAMPHLVWVANEQGVVEYYNARMREYRGIEQGADNTWRWQPLVHPDDLERTTQTWAEAMASEHGEYECEHRIQMADGTYRWHISRAHRVRDDRGATWFGTATDIHDRKLVEDRLRLAIATRDQIISVVAHDLRNPLGAAQLAIGMIHDAFAEAPEAVREGAGQTLARLERQVERMDRIVAELLDVATLQGGEQLHLERRPCDLLAVVRQAIAEHATRTHAIELRAGPAEITGAWDVGRVERAIGNLLSNAIKYSPAGSTVDVEVDARGGKAIVRVRDRGIGIPPQDLARVFEWFTRSANAREVAPGTGIGLAGARQIIEQHGGTLGVESTLGAGSTFIVELPLGNT